MDKFRIIGGLILIAAVTFNYVISVYDIAINFGFFYGAMLAIGGAFLLFGKNLFQKKH